MILMAIVGKRDAAEVDTVITCHIDQQGSGSDVDAWASNHSLNRRGRGTAHLDRSCQHEGRSSGWVLCDCGPWSLCSGAKSEQGLGGCLSSTGTSLAGRVAGRDFIAVSSADGGVVVDAPPREDAEPLVLALAASLQQVRALS
jgi:hypothetical protein